MNKAVASLINSFFKSKSGRPNKVLQHLGEEQLGNILSQTFKKGKPTLETLETITKLNNDKTQGIRKKDIAEAAKRFTDPSAYEKKKHDFILQDIISPLLSRATRHAGNVIALQKQVPYAAAEAAANRLASSIDDRIVQGSPIMAGVAATYPTINAAANLQKHATTALVKGIADTAASTVEHATNELRKENDRRRLEQMINDKTLVQGSAPSNAYYDLLNRQERNAQQNQQQDAFGGF